MLSANTKECINRRRTRSKNNPLRTKLYLSNLKTQFVPLRKLSASVIKTAKLLPYREKIAVFSEIHAKHKNAIWAEHRISEC